LLFVLVLTLALTPIILIVHPQPDHSDPLSIPLPLPNVCGEPAMVGRGGGARKDAGAGVDGSTGRSKLIAPCRSSACTASSYRDILALALRHSSATHRCLWPTSEQS